MNSQILKKTMLRNLAMSAVMLLALAGAARAQDSGIQASGPNGMLQAKDAADQKSIKEYINRRENDAKYQETIHEQQSAPTLERSLGQCAPDNADDAWRQICREAGHEIREQHDQAGEACHAGATPNGQ